MMNYGCKCGAFELEKRSKELAKTENTVNVQSVPEHTTKTTSTIRKCRDCESDDIDNNDCECGCTCGITPAPCPHCGDSHGIPICNSCGSDSTYTIHVSPDYSLHYASFRLVGDNHKYKAGDMRYNEETGKLEIYVDTGWYSLT